MNPYHKIQTVFLRDPATNFKTLLDGQWAEPEFGYLANNEWVFTEKVDGTNIRVTFTPAPVPSVPGEHVSGIKFGGRTDDAQIPTFLLTRLQERFAPLLDLLFATFPEHIVTFYGEGYGARIQKGGGNYRPDADFVLFDINIAGWWLQRHDVEGIAVKLGLDV